MRGARGIALAALIAWAVALGDASAAERAELETPVAAPLPAGWSAPPGDAATAPGREAVAAPPPEAVLLLAWGGNYRTILAIGPGAGTERPAWIVTYSEPEHELQVAYAAAAFRDRQGVMHFDGRNALMTGQMAEAGQWSPDSFAVFADGSVQTQDDSPDHPHERGVITRVVRPTDADYGALLLMAQAMAADGT